MMTYKEYVLEVLDDFKLSAKHDEETASEIAGIAAVLAVILILSGAFSIGFLTWAPFLFVLAAFVTFAILFAVISVVYTYVYWLFNERLGR
jgi:hypothetical protein